MTTKKVKKKKNSKSLGNNYEREFSKKFSKWITGSEDNLICWRNVHSGSISTIREKKGQDGSTSNGDFQCLDSNYQYIFDFFHIDSKSYGSFNPLFTNKKNQKSNDIFQQWVKTVKEAQQVNKVPLMPVKIRNGTPEFIIMPFYFVVESESCIYYKIEISSDYSCKLIFLDDFFENNNIDDLVKKKYLNTYLNKEGSKYEKS